jgi:hypothetical protein
VPAEAGAGNVRSLAWTASSSLLSLILQAQTIPTCYHSPRQRPKTSGFAAYLLAPSPDLVRFITATSTENSLDQPLRFLLTVHRTTLPCSHQVSIPLLMLGPRGCVYPSDKDHAADLAISLYSTPCRSSFATSTVGLWPSVCPCTYSLLYPLTERDRRRRCRASCHRNLASRHRQPHWHRRRCPAAHPGRAATRRCRRSPARLQPRPEREVCWKAGGRTFRLLTVVLRLRGGKKRCAFLVSPTERCSSPALSIIGDCPECQAKHCGRHRLPEVRQRRLARATGLSSCR